MMKLNIIKSSRCALAFVAMGLLAGCTPDEAGKGNPITSSDMDASFTVTQTSANHYELMGETAGIMANRWKIGDAAGYKGKTTEDIFLPDAGTYTITHTVYGAGGYSNTATQTITVDTPDPVAGNLIINGKFEDGNANWNILDISSSGAAWTFENGMASVTATDYNQKAIYQPVEVVGGVPYNIDMSVSGQGSTDTWFEVYVSPTAPVQGSDYSADGIRFSLNTWAGCATTPFEGQISAVGCGDHSGNPITFANSGIVYFLIKCGGGNVGTINVDNVEMRRVSN